MVRGPKVFSLALFLGAVIAAIGAIYIYASKEDGSYTKLYEEIKDLKAHTITSVGLTAILAERDRKSNERVQEYIELACDRSTKEQLRPVLSTVEQAMQSAERLAKEYEFMKAQLHSIDKRIVGQTKTVKFEFNRPVPVEVIRPERPVPEPPEPITPLPKGKANVTPPPKKESLLKRSGLKTHD